MSRLGDPMEVHNLMTQVNLLHSLAVLIQQVDDAQTIEAILKCL